jgi:hypothetical protein
LDLDASKKSLKIPKGKSEAMNQRRTDKTMVKMKNDKRTNNDLERTTEKTKDYLTLSVYFMVADLALSVD